MGSIILLDLMGGVALLLWGLHMVLTGVLRAFGPHLRRFLGKALGNRFSAFGAGLGMTALLQSSTATGTRYTHVSPCAGTMHNIGGNAAARRRYRSQLQ